MFGISSLEFLVIILVAIVVVGPEKMPGIMRTVAKMLSEFRRVKTDFHRIMNLELASMDLEKAKKTFPPLVSEPIVSKAQDTTPAAPEAAPAEATPPDSTPAEASPAQANPAEAIPPETTPADTVTVAEQQDSPVSIPVADTTQSTQPDTVHSEAPSVAPSSNKEGQA
jgi:sec-independent protein translocase protein TatB